MDINDFTSTGQQLLREGKQQGHDIAIIVRDPKLRVIGTAAADYMSHIRGISQEHETVKLNDVSGL